MCQDDGWDKDFGCIKESCHIEGGDVGDIVEIDFISRCGEHRTRSVAIGGDRVVRGDDEWRPCGTPVEEPYRLLDDSMDQP